MKYLNFSKFNLTYVNSELIQIWQRIDDVPEHIWYIYISLNSGTAYFGFNNIYDGEHHWPYYKSILNSKNNPSTNGFFIDKQFATGGSIYLFELFFEESIKDVSYKYINVVDLTLMFGKENEPDKDWCDKYLTDYLEYNLEGTLTPIKEIGEPIKTSYYDKIDIFD